GAFTCEHAKVSEDDYGSAERIIIEEIRESAKFALPAGLHPPPWPEAPEGSLLNAALTAWARACPLPLVLFIDEIDALRGQSLISGRTPSPRQWCSVGCGTCVTTGPSPT